MVVRKRKLQEFYQTVFIAHYILAENVEEEDEAFAAYLERTKYLYAKRYLQSRQPIPKSRHFNGILSEYDDDRFARYSRTSKEMFLELLNLIKDNPVFYQPTGRPQIITDLQLLITLFRLGHSGNAASILEVSSRFGVSDGGTIANCTKRVIKAFCSLSAEIIKWPSSCERRTIAQESGLHGLPNCIAYIDGSHIRLSREPSGDGLSYFNRKQFYSLNLAAVATRDHKIIAFQLGYPGKVHDACVYKSMALYKNPHQFFGHNEYIVGDPAYPI
uniref:DDE Tnp4 domain-containing protein n=1 Tax=Strigamia maritima TaxID=126957 RepID=T1J7F6_STRMM